MDQTLQPGWERGTRHPLEGESTDGPARRGEELGSQHTAS